MIQSLQAVRYPPKIKEKKERQKKRKIAKKKKRKEKKKATRIKILLESPFGLSSHIQDC